MLATTFYIILAIILFHASVLFVTYERERLEFLRYPLLWRGFTTVNRQHRAFP